MQNRNLTSFEIVLNSVRSTQVRSFRVLDNSFSTLFREDPPLLISDSLRFGPGVYQSNARPFTAAPSCAGDTILFSCSNFWIQTCGSNSLSKGFVRQGFYSPDLGGQRLVAAHCALRTPSSSPVHGVALATASKYTMIHWLSSKCNRLPGVPIKSRQPPAVSFQLRTRLSLRLPVWISAWLMADH